jgi:acetyltransferase-like isoleucine patch superfamily enzyme
VRGSRIEIGERCFVDSFVKIKPVGGTGDVILGESCYLNSGTVLYSGNGIKLGKNVLIAANCTLAPVNHSYGRRDVPIIAQGFMPSRGGIVIEDDVWLGANCVVLDGTHIESGAVIAAGSVVRGRITGFALWGGSPCRKLKDRP